MTDERERIEQSNAVAGIVIDVMRAETPHMSPLLNLRYGIADALWEAGYRRVPQNLDPKPYTFQAGRFKDADIYGDRYFSPRQGYSQNPEDYK